MTTVLPTSKIALVLNSKVVTNNVKEAISHAMKCAPVQTYLCQRNAWTPDTFSLIDGLSFERYFKSIPMAKRIKVSKYVHDWQNTGSQKEKFARSNHRKDPLDEVEYHAFSQCPMNCGEYEEPQHYLHCRKNPKPEEITRCVQSIARWMKKAGTSKPLMIIILKAMRAWLQEGILEIEWNFPEDEDHDGFTGLSSTAIHRMAQLLQRPHQQSMDRHTATRILETEPTSHRYKRRTITQTLLRNLVGRKPHQASCIREPEPLANSQ